MTLTELIAAARTRCDDLAAPYLCSDVTFAQFANDGQNETCRRSRLIVDTASPELCSIAYTANAESMDLDERVLFVRRARWVGSDGNIRRLTPVATADLDSRPEWESETDTVPRAFVIDMNENSLRLYPTPTVAGTVKMTVVRLPLLEMEADADRPEIRPHLHYALVDWMEHRYFALPDADINDPKRSEAAMRRFEIEFGKKSSAQDESWLRRNAGFLEAEGNY